jgi:hypothetical protein
MKFLMRNKILILFGTTFTVLLLAIFWPEAKKPGELQKYYTRPPDQLMMISYSGEMQLGDKRKAGVSYEIHREENPLQPKEAVYRIEISELSTEDKGLAKRVSELSAVKRFYASALIKSVILDWAAPDYYFVLPYEQLGDNDGSAEKSARDRDAEYGFKDCPNLLKLQFKADQQEFCIGTATQGDSRRYLLDRKKNKIVIGPDFTVRRLVNNIFAQREPLLHPYGSEGIDTLELKVSPQLLAKYPLLREKTGGILKLRMLIKDEGKKKINVWHVDNLLSIKPSHAAEYATLLQAMRINALLALDAPPATATAAEILQKAGLDEKTIPAIEGAFSIKHTDKQDTLLARYAFFSPMVRTDSKLALQSDNTLVRPLDSLVLSSFNAGYISADLYPRMQAILQKIENDLREAQKVGEEKKAQKAQQVPGTEPKKK